MKSNITYLGIPQRAKKIYDAIAKVYAEKIDLKLDFALLAIYARSVHQLEIAYKAAENEAKLYYQTSNGSYAAHPLRDEISMLEKRIESVADALGLSPKSRARIKKAKNPGRPQKGFRARIEGALEGEDK